MILKAVASNRTPYAPRGSQALVDTPVARLRKPLVCDPSRSVWSAPACWRFCLRRPAGVDQSISPAHQLSIEGMFAWSDAQKVKRLLDESIRYFRTLAQAILQRPVPP